MSQQSRKQQSPVPTPSPDVGPSPTSERARVHEGSIEEQYAALRPSSRFDGGGVPGSQFGVLPSGTNYDASLAGLSPFGGMHSGDRETEASGDATDAAFPTYVVQPGDWLASIAERFDISLAEVMHVNPRLGPPERRWDRIFPGDVVRIPSGIEPKQNQPARTQGLPKTRNDAIIRHRLNQKRVFELMMKGVTLGKDVNKPYTDEDNMLANTAEWIKGGEVTLTVLSPTHDADTRRPGTRAYFDATVKFPDLGGTYPTKSNSRSNSIKYENPGDVGSLSRDGMNLFLYDPSPQNGVSDADLRRTLVHEVSHDADQTRTHPGQGSVVDNGYKSEFRAYWLQNEEGSAGDRAFWKQASAFEKKWGPGDFPSSKKHASNQKLGLFKPTFKNARQEAIARLLSNPGRGYPYGLQYQLKPDFRDLVHDFHLPASVNAVNSVRIEELLGEARDHSSLAAQTDQEAIFLAVRKLDTQDRKFLADSTISAPFWSAVSADNPAVAKLIREFLDNPGRVPA